MKKFNKIVLYDIEPAPVSGFLIKELKKMCKTLKIYKAKDDFTGALKKSDIYDADCLISNPLEKYGSALFDGTKIKYVGLMYTTVSDIDLAWFKRKKIAVTNCSWYCREDVAEQTMAMLLEIARNVHDSMDFAKAGGFGYASFKRKSWYLKGKTIGIVGYGKIGSRVAELAESFGMNVIYYSKHKKNVKYKFVSINKLLKTSDVVSLHMNLSKETEEFLNASRIKLMKPGCILLNSARGELVDYSAFYTRCKKGDIKIWFDQLQEKDWRDKMRKLTNAYLTPWNSSNSIDAHANLELEVLENASAFLQGKKVGRVA